MKYTDFRKQQAQHIRCAVCGKNFTSVFDDEINAHPLYHPLQPQEKKFESCEHRFYKSLLRIYLFLNHIPNSVTMHMMLNDFDWLGHVLMKKEMITWCLSRGYLTLDQLSRIELPEAIFDPLKEIFARYNLSNADNLDEAAEILKAALRCFKDDLEPEEDDDDEEVKQDFSVKNSLEKNEEPAKMKSLRMHTAESLSAAKISERRNRSRV